MNTADIDKVVGQGTFAGGVEPFSAIAFSKRDELLVGPQFGPGLGNFKELVGEGLDVRTEFARSADNAVGSTKGVGRLLFGIVVEIGRTPSPRLPRVDFAPGALSFAAAP